MGFLDWFDTSEKDKLLAVATEVRLEPGDALFRRGEKGGDVFLVREGSLEVVDTRAHPEMVLGVIGPGAVTGEMAFLDNSPRSADVRAARTATEPTRIYCWEKPLLSRVMDDDAALSVAFFRAVAQTQVSRLRDSNTSQVRDAQGDVSHSGLAQIESQAHAVAGKACQVWLEAESRLRKDADDETGRDEIIRCFDELRAEALEWLDGLSDHAARVLAGSQLHKELHPYLVRAQLVADMADWDEGPGGRHKVLAHLLNGSGSGEGALGQHLDTYLLGLPTSRAIRERSQVAAEAALDGLDGEDALRVLLLPVGCGALLSRLIHARSDRPVVITCVDDENNAEALANAERGLGYLPAKVDLTWRSEKLASWCMGRSESHYDRQDVIVLNGLVEYLPDRLLAGVLGWCHQHLKSDGRLVLSTLCPSQDQVVFDHFLAWPTLRRTQGDLERLLQGAVFSDISISGVAPALVVCARHRAAPRKPAISPDPEDPGHAPVNT
ncbi:MAG: cyclic nucleotide-binding domain-containing protein [Myxococcota bacterium]|nr:cyclic nucleotide-binding domain-containing protein [Myxococcota bacterium]